MNITTELRKATREEIETLKALGEMFIAKSLKLISEQPKNTFTNLAEKVSNKNFKYEVIGKALQITDLTEGCFFSMKLPAYKNSL